MFWAMPFVLPAEGYPYRVLTVFPKKHVYSMEAKEKSRQSIVPDSIPKAVIFNAVPAMIMVYNQADSIFLSSPCVFCALG